MTLAMTLALLGCVEQGFTAVELDAIAVVNGDFDDLGGVLLRNEVGNQAFNGYISQSTTWVGDDPPAREDPGRTVEELLTDPVQDLSKFQIDQFQAVFINSGTRGLNAFEYNHTLTPDDSLLLDETAVANICAFPEGGGALFITDWSYDLVEACWPDAITFANDDTVVDDAQVGVAGEVLADVADEALQTALDSTVANVLFNYSAFSVMKSVSADVEVLITGDVTYQPLEGGDTSVFKGVPLAVRIPIGQRGQVFFSSFHLHPQTAALADALIFRGMDGLERGAGDQSEEALSE
jgi:hypothetical protein